MELERGLCPECGSGEVTHYTFGLVVDPEGLRDAPPWVRDVGCVETTADRACDDCGHDWSSWTTDDPVRGS
jgi:RNA polymerase subunit RPABC4/transcription elongation factor Spt4